MGRGILYFLTMTGVVVTIGIVVNIILAAANIDIGVSNFWMLLAISAVMGFVGSIIGLFGSKSMCIRHMGVKVIMYPQNEAENWLVKTIELLATKKGLKMPEVGIYSSNEMNAFATGWNKDSALVAVSTGLLDKMNQEEIEAVLGHEMSHVQNGDMVTMCLLQGLINTFVYLSSFIISFLLRGNNGKQNVGSSFLLRQLCIIVFGFLGNLVMLAFSRWREYRADAGSAEVLGKQAMIHALEALSNQDLDPKPEGMKALCIFGSTSISEIFMTHPPLEKRIAALKKLKK